LLAISIQSLRTISGTSIMRKLTIVAVASMLTVGPALADHPAAAAGATMAQAKPAAVTPHPAPAKQAAPASTPESRSADALALTHEPTYDEGTAQRIREAAFSYSDIAVRGGWPTIPAEAKFAIGVKGEHDDLLRKRLLMSGDLGDDKGGAHDATVVEALKRFQSRHGIAPTGTMTPRTVAALNVSVQKRIRQLEASLERVQSTKFAFGPRYVVVNLPATYAEAVENDVVVRRYRVVVGK